MNLLIVQLIISVNYMENSKEQGDLPNGYEAW